MENQDIKIADIDMLSKSEKDKILYEFNNTDTDYPRDKTIAKIFEEQVKKSPESIAVVFENKQLTYRELNEKANILASHLKEKGIGRNDIVGILINRSLEMIISMFAVIKSGSAYLLIDQNLPNQRIEYMLDNSKTSLLITNKSSKELNFNNILSLNTVDWSKETDNFNSFENIPSDSLAVIYTSGSTGIPKGVLLSHNGFVNLIYAFDKCMSIAKYNRFLSMAAVSFDMFTVEILSSILFGKTLYLLNEEETKNPILIAEIISKNKIEFLISTPTKMELLLADESTAKCLKNLKAFQLGGEVFSGELYNKLIKYTSAKIYNGYGPAEVSACSSNKLVLSPDNINIGKPINNIKILILNKDMNLCPIGVPGEIYIIGDGVSKGYINKKSATDKAFIFNKTFNAIMYKSGDLGLYNENGEIVYLGRNDTQVKIRGLRIELSEIEKQIKLIDGIENCVVIFDNKNTALKAFYISNSGIDHTYIRLKLSNVLPSYMIPNYIIQVKDFPMSNNGKIDFNKLNSYDISSPVKTKYKAPTNELEEKMCEILENLLNIKVGINDDLFSIGMDSLMAINFKTELVKYNINIPYSNLFKYKTIKELAISCSSKSNERMPAIEHTDFSKFDELLNKNIYNKNYSVSHSKNNNVLLLGASGFVGMHILSNFIKHDKGKIYCIVRSKKDISAKERFINTLHFYFKNSLDKYIDKRIFVVEGDILKLNYGLNISDLKNIFNNISCVINTAALVKHHGDYADFKSTNIDSLERTINLCIEYNKRLIHISSMSISESVNVETEDIPEINLPINKEKFDEYKEVNFYTGQKLNNIYIRSKFEAEYVVLDNIKNGLDAQIIRLGNITNRYSDGVFQINANSNAFANRIKSFLAIGSVPDYLSDLEVEFTPVDYCGLAIIKILQNKVENISIYHVFDHKTIKANTMFKILNHMKINIKVLSQDNFINLVNSIAQNNNLRDNISGIVTDLDENNILPYKPDIINKSDVTIKYLSDFGFKWPKINRSYIKKYIDNLNLYKGEK